MGKHKEFKQEIEKLIEDGGKLYSALILEEKNQEHEDCKDLPYFIRNYETWYTKALAVIKQITPDRYSDFTKLYSEGKKRELTSTTYCIADALRGIYSGNYHYGPWDASLCVFRQVSMLQACLDSFDSKVFDIQTTLQADIFDSELDSAKHLLKVGFLRPAGAICGVVIEKHLSKVCENRGISLKKKHPAIIDYNDALKDVAYDVVEWRRIQRLADIRNLCDHNKDREPTKDEVEELISGTEKLIKTVF